MMKRLVLFITAVLACAVLAVPATGTPVGQPAGRAAASTTLHAQVAASQHGHPVTLRWLRNNLIDFHIGPRRATGYGKSRITGFQRGCPECRWFRATNRLTDHPPVDPTSAEASASDASLRRGGFCWPWNDFPWSGSSCWNDMSTWNWGAILDVFNYHPVWDPRSTTDRILGCYHGAYNGLSLGIFGKTFVGLLLEMGDLIKFTPAGAAYTILGGCVFNLFH